jgi:hypothetical protein
LTIFAFTQFCQNIAPSHFLFSTGSSQFFTWSILEIFTKILVERIFDIRLTSSVMTSQSWPFLSFFDFFRNIAPGNFFVSSWILSIFGVELLWDMDLNLVERIFDFQLGSPMTAPKSWAFC